MNIEGEPGHKRYRVMNRVDDGVVLDSFDDLEQAIAYAGGLRVDRCYVIRDRGRAIVWPKDANGE